MISYKPPIVKEASNEVHRVSWSSGLTVPLKITLDQGIISKYLMESCGFGSDQYSHVVKCCMVPPSILLAWGSPSMCILDLSFLRITLLLNINSQNIWRFAIQVLVNTFPFNTHTYVRTYSRTYTHKTYIHTCVCVVKLT